MVCKNCGQNVADNSQFCTSCGAKMESTPDNTSAENNVSSTDITPGKGAAIVSLVLGIVSIVVSFFGFASIAGIVCGIIGIIFANKSKNAGNTGGMRNAGLVLSIIGLIIGCIALIVTVCVIVFIGTAAVAVTSVMESMGAM